MSLRARKSCHRLLVPPQGPGPVQASEASCPGPEGRRGSSLSLGIRWTPDVKPLDGQRGSPLLASGSPASGRTCNGSYYLAALGRQLPVWRLLQESGKKEAPYRLPARPRFWGPPVPAARPAFGDRPLARQARPPAPVSVTPPVCRL